MAPLHPLIVHFPIVLLIAAAVFYLLSLIRPENGFGKTGFYLHAAGLLFSIAAILTGDYSESNIVQTNAIHELVELHELLGMMSTWGFGLLALWVFLRQKSNIAIEKIVYVVIFWMVIGVLAYSAHLGGRMVYEHGAGIAPMDAQLELIHEQESKIDKENKAHENE